MQASQVLDEKLGETILNIIDTNPITTRQTSSIKILPNEVFEISNFNGFFINGLGYKKLKPLGFTIDELLFFEKFKRQVISKTSQDILNKLKTNLIYWKNADTGEFEEVCTIYKALNYETSYRSKKFILVSGKWYEIDKEFYSTLQKDIDNITEPDFIVKFIDFDSNIHFQNSKEEKTAK